MKFIYVLPGWEGYVADSRVFRDEKPEDQLLDDVDRDLKNASTVEDEDVDNEYIRVVKVTQELTTFRDALAMKMFAEY